MLALWPWRWLRSYTFSWLRHPRNMTVTSRIHSSHEIQRVGEDYLCKVCGRHGRTTFRGLARQCRKTPTLAGKRALKAVQEGKPLPRTRPLARQVKRAGETVARGSTDLPADHEGQGKGAEQPSKRTSLQIRLLEQWRAAKIREVSAAGAGLN